MSYFIVYKNYKQKTFDCIRSILNFNEAVWLVEATALNFIRNKQGEVYNDIFYDKSKSGKYGKCPMGYFVCKGSKSVKYTIFHKFIDEGYIYNTIKIVKICSFEICKLPASLKVQTPINRHDFYEDAFDELCTNKLRQFNSVNMQIKEKAWTLHSRDDEKK